ncbi:DGQHR domain-containing protein [Maritimibacter dapengensis]|uniref:DGQHR domain-containing protein n=1 Tax=Maritimibacter dapengensis TaxID=2836868 RepID=A0ABS6SWJ8_9RHOB|nr:DGQHR domain-containing protein [Maritimibacter dapengensis]MBV7377294.1 DGQHR domain-containing protein [Maritimibacter dapengensis]
MKAEKHRQVPAIPVHQWLKGWDHVSFDESEHRAKPQKQFYLFSLPARELRSLSGISRRQAKDASPRTEDLGIQRQHDPERSEEISRFVEYGYPWSTLGQAKRDSAEFHSLRKPGWLPTAVVLNVLCKGHKRFGNTVAAQDVVTVEESECGPRVSLPYKKWTKTWRPAQLPPFEVIDGQHRLWAFDEADDLEGFELPVVAFVGLDISWQAYLFWTINIKPKRINPSLAFDLYPLLRSEEWLEQAETHVVYRETRAQELTELLWSLPTSPWYDRINMLGERKNRWVTQSAWIKSLAASFVRSWDRRSGLSGGLFGGRSKKGEEVLGWSRAQQAAFLVYAWDQFRKLVAESEEDWARALRTPPSIDGEPAPRPEDVPTGFDLAFYSPHSLITTDQGVRGFLQVLNDMFYLRAPKLRLNQWRPDERSKADPLRSVETEIESLKKQDFVWFVQEICTALCTFDWRTSAAPAISDELRRKKLVFRGSSGYKELRVQLLEHLLSHEGEVGETAQELLKRI